MMFKDFPNFVKNDFGTAKVQLSVSGFARRKQQKYFSCQSDKRNRKRNNKTDIFFRKLQKTSEYLTPTSFTFWVPLKICMSDICFISSIFVIIK